LFNCLSFFCCSKSSVFHARSEGKLLTAKVA
jgi:hypothetical protein